MIDSKDSRSNRLTRWEHWLSLRQEIPLHPGQRLIDAHHHLWDREGHTYLLDEFEHDVAENNIVASVYVECLSSYREDGLPEMRCVGETERIAALSSKRADPAGMLRGIIGFADLALGVRVEPVLDAHALAAPQFFKGIRYATAWDCDPAIHSSYPTYAGMLLDTEVSAGARVLAKRGLSLDLWLYFHQLGEAQRFARMNPDLSLIIDHCGGPLGIGRFAGLRSMVFSEWREHLQAFRTLDNVSLKFGGLAMPLAGFGWKARDLPPSSDELASAWDPYFDVCLEVFGAQRCMFESNFPVDRAGCGYTIIWNAFKRLAERLTTDERAALFETTARRVYCLAD